MTRPLMVLGCTSDAGKSLVATGLCRWFARQGVRVAPFKAQNMSNNARVVADPMHGVGEIGVAQWLQALAAGVTPDVRMNPVLLKPEADTESQAVVRGHVDRALSATPWNERHDALWEPMASSFDELRAEFDLVVIEGAGSPAEINLRDQVNNRMIDHADAHGVLVSDIDRGGSFAHLFGTWSLVPESTRRRLDGFVLNKFRGDPSLLEPGPRLLTDRTAMRHVGTLPMLTHGLPREEGGIEDRFGGFAVAADAPTVAILRFPYGSNLDEFHLLAQSANVRWVSSPADVDRLRPDADLVIIPGSKHVVADLAWLRERDLEESIRSAAARGTRVVGICGGAMMLGHSIDDPHGVEGATAGGPTGTRGVGMLPYSTTMATEKLVGITTCRFADLDPRWADLEGLDVAGYEIRYGRIVAPVDDDRADSTMWTDGVVLATTTHGLFEDRRVIEAMLGITAGPGLDRPGLDGTFDLLADAVDANLDTVWLRSLVG